MATPTINLQPASLDLLLYAGDGASINLNCKDSEEVDAEPVDMSGAVAAQIRFAHGETGTPLATFDVDMTDAVTGVIVLSLTAADTRTLSDDEASAGGKFTGVWDVQWTPPGSSPRTFIQGRVECVDDVTR